MNRPNLFQIATKELSQDAFFTWLLQWADDSNMKEDKDLCIVGKKFASMLLKEALGKDIEINTVNAGRQWDNIDIWAEINNDIILIIEDKTNTGEHSKQLERYRDYVLNYEKKYKEYAFIYLKTGFESKNSMKKKLAKDWFTVGRKELLSFFNENNLMNNYIYSDFISNLNVIENKALSFETKKIKDWSKSSWKGFYEFLDDNLKITDWRYVSNPSGGFWGLWWNFIDFVDDPITHSVYLQIDGNKLCFKMRHDEEDVGKNQLTELAQEWYDILIKKNENRLNIKRSSRIAAGRSMTFAVIDKKDWLGDDDTVINKEEVLEKLKSYENFLNDVCKEYK